MLNILSIDVEEYFHPTEVGLEMSRWTSMVSLVESQTSAVLDMKTTVLFSTIFMLVVMYSGASFRRFRAIAMLLLGIAMGLAIICSHQSASPFQCIVLDKDANPVRPGPLDDSDEVDRAENVCQQGVGGPVRGSLV